MKFSAPETLKSQILSVSLLSYAGYPYAAAYGAFPHAVAATTAGLVHSSHVGLCTNYLGAAIQYLHKDLIFARLTVFRYDSHPSRLMIFIEESMSCRPFKYIQMEY